MGTPRIRLSAEEYQLIQEYRGNGGSGDTSFKQSGEKAEYSFKTSKRIRTLQDLIDVCDIDLTQWDIERWICNKWEVGRKNKTVELKWENGLATGGVNDKGNVFVEPLFQVKVWLKPKAGKSFADLAKEVLADVKKYAPKYPVIKYKKVTDGHLLVIDPADVHIGKLCLAFETGEDYNNQVAVKRVLEGVDGIVNKAQGFKVDQILFVIGNDILHIDTPKRTTTSGTPQDTDGMWHNNFRIAKRLYIEIIEKLLTIAPVHIQYDPSNHDYTNGFFLADTITSWFAKCKAVTSNVTPAHRKYFRYYNNIIGTTHNDGAKEQDLALLMAHEAGKDWHECKHRYIYTHHIHHKKSKDYMSVCVEALRSPSGADSWHHRNGYQHAPKAIEGYLHHKNHGQIARFTHLF